MGWDNVASSWSCYCTTSKFCFPFQRGFWSSSWRFLKFWTLTAASGWNKQAILTTYHQGLNPALRLQIGYLRLHHRTWEVYPTFYLCCLLQAKLLGRWANLAVLPTSFPAKEIRHSRSRTHTSGKYLVACYRKKTPADPKSLPILWGKRSLYCRLSHSSSMPHGEFCFQ